MKTRAAIIMFLGLMASTSCKKEVPVVAEEKGEGVRAPELSGGTGWTNTRQPLTLAQLRGKFVLLDFWTYG